MNKSSFKKGHVPHNKIQDEYSELKMSRQMKYYLRKAKKLQTKPLEAIDGK